MQDTYVFDLAFWGILQEDAGSHSQALPRSTCFAELCVSGPGSGPELREGPDTDNPCRYSWE
jgi:hypothetical protein